METSECSFHHEPYRRVPRNSATTPRDWTEYNSIGTFSTYSSNWSRSRYPTMTTKYIDGRTMLGQYDRPYSTKDLFPKGKARQKPFRTPEKKDARDAYISLLPADETTIQSEKTRPPSSTTQTSNLPEVKPKSASSQNTYRSHTIIFDDDSQSKFYARCATTNASGSWIRRYKSINQSQILSDLFRDQPYQIKTLLKKRSYQQLLLSSLSSFTSLYKRRREKCE